MTEFNIHEYYNIVKGLGIDLPDIEHISEIAHLENREDGLFLTFYSDAPSSRRQPSSGQITYSLSFEDFVYLISDTNARAAESSGLIADGLRHKIIPIQQI